MNRYNTQLFIEKAIEIHGELYDYSNVQYKSYHDKVKIVCKKHGLFYQAPSKHLNNQGCPECSSTHKMDTDNFINKANKVHNNFYDYSETEYIRSNEKVKIICPVHGFFSQEANSHLCGKKCPKCSLLIRALKRKDSKEDFIKKANKVHNEKYDYSLVNYKNNKTLVKIICSNHGVFEQRPDGHVYHKQGCPKCGGTSKITREEFVKRSNDRHECFFDYSLVKFNSIKDKVEIICPKHGVFSQNVKAHMDGNGCPKCKTSKLEKKILKILKESFKKIDIIQFYKSTWLGRQHIDIFLPQFNIAIECHGVQHYEVVEKFGGENAFRKRLKLDAKKRFLCKENKITLYEIPYFYDKNQINEVIKKIKEKILHNKKLF